MTLSETLQKIGLNKYESNAYSALCYSDILTAVQVSKRSKVPSSKIYEVLDSLIQKGFVKIELGKPKRYLAVPVQQVLKRLSCNKLKEAQELEKLSEDFKNIKPKQEFDIWVVKGKKECLEALEKCIIDSKESIDGFAFEGIAMSKKSHIIKQAISRGVKIRFIVSDKMKENAKLLKNTGADVQLISQKDFEPFRAGVVDNELGIISTSGYSEDVSIIFMKNPEIVRFISGLFKYWWKKGKEIQ